MAFLFPFFFRKSSIESYLGFSLYAKGDVFLVNYNNKGLQWCGCSPFVKIWLIGEGSCRLCLCRGNLIRAACFSVYRGRVASGIG